MRIVAHLCMQAAPRSLASLSAAAVVMLLILGWPADARADWLADLEAPLRSALAAGSWTTVLGLSFAAGIATSLTPCVYPMIVITVSVFGARQTPSKLRAAQLSCAFVLGIAALFTPLGVMAALTGDMFGSQLSNPVVLCALALVFIALAASMFGAFELDLPSEWKNRLAMTGGSGLRGAFVLGMVSSLVAAPCTGPVVGFLLTWIGTTRDVSVGAASFFSYSLGLGMLFFLVGTFSMSLPKSGRWLESIKSVFGIAMLVAALYFIRDLLPSPMRVVARSAPVLLVSSGLCVLGLVLGSIHLSFYDASKLRRARKALGIAFAVAGMFGLIGYAQAIPEGARLRWLHDYAEAKRRALTSGRPLLVDFGASWCGACGELERHTFSDARVVHEGQRFTAVRIDLSPGEDTPAKQAILRGYNQRGLPLVVLHDSSGREVTRVTNFVEPTKFLELLRSVQ